MSRQSCDPSVANSSIALLQERFRQLERAKEKREGRELVGRISDKHRGDRTMHLEHANNVPSPHHHHHMGNAPRSSRRDFSLSLGLNAHSGDGDYRALNDMPLTSLWLKPPVSGSASVNFDTSDVDTSLHL